MEKKNRSSLVIILILLLLLLATISVTVWAVFFRDTTPVLAPDYAPQENDKNAIELEDQNQEKLEQQQGGGAVEIRYVPEASIDLATRMAVIAVENPAKSNQNMMVQLVIQNKVIAQTGIIRTGYKINKVNIFDNVELSAGVYKGKYVIYYYQDDTGEKAILNTEIPIDITVQ